MNHHYLKLCLESIITAHGELLTLLIRKVEELKINPSKTHLNWFLSKQRINNRKYIIHYQIEGKIIKKNPFENTGYKI